MPVSHTVPGPGPISRVSRVHLHVHVSWWQICGAQLPSHPSFRTPAFTHIPAITSLPPYPRFVVPKYPERDSASTKEFAKAADTVLPAYAKYVTK